MLVVGIGSDLLHSTPIERPKLHGLIQMVSAVGCVLFDIWYANVTQHTHVNHSETFERESMFDLMRIDIY